MKEMEDKSIDLIVTSPPYWHIKDYGVPYQIGYGQSLHHYLKDLYLVWKECFRVLRNGGRLCINIGDQFARGVIYGKYKIIPIHSEIILQCEKIGFDFMGSIIWQKKTKMNTTGGANIMGSFPYPPNGIVEIDYEFIHIFKKPGKNKKVPKEIKEASKLTKKEWKEYFLGHWNFGGVKQINHEAMFPEELPKRLIKMFSFVGDTVLDPFLGSGTTLKVALKLNRNGIGYEINKEFLKIIKEKLGILEKTFDIFQNIEIYERKEKVEIPYDKEYNPSLKDLSPYIDPKNSNFKRDKLYKVIDFGEDFLKLENGKEVKFLGVIIEKKKEFLEYMKNHILGKEIFLKFDSNKVEDRDKIKAYIYLKNKIFINSYLIKSGIARPDLSMDFKYKNKFIILFKEKFKNKGIRRYIKE
ncbi:MAG: site-specific DNA-methyltransferase [Dictyoglomaceae bacterium]|nr:site-specific DNA-methyltransferase [Dictyoglomaceae bacterium]